MTNSCTGMGVAREARMQRQRSVFYRYQVAVDGFAIIRFFSYHTTDFSQWTPTTVYIPGHVDCQNDLIN